MQAQTVQGLPTIAPQGDLRRGRELLMARQFAAAKQVFEAFVAAHPATDSAAVQAELGVGDAQLGLGEYEAAETTYRAVVAAQPELWQAHKNLVVVEAALERWEEFDRERTVLRMARERGAPGISALESDVIDSFTVRGEHWVVRAYFEPLGRSQARYNFERFSPDGRVAAYLSLEDAAAARAALTPGDVRIGTTGPGAAANAKAEDTLSLNWYTGRAHGLIRNYSRGEPGNVPSHESGEKPSYERLRIDVMRWLRQHPSGAVAGSAGPAPPRTGADAQP